MKVQRRYKYLKIDKSEIKRVLGLTSMVIIIDIFSSLLFFVKQNQIIRQTGAKK